MPKRKRQTNVCIDDEAIQLKKPFLSALKAKLQNRSLFDALPNLKVLIENYSHVFLVQFMKARPLENFVPPHPPTFDEFNKKRYRDRRHYAIKLEKKFDFSQYYKYMFSLGCEYFGKFNETRVLREMPCYMCSFFDFEHEPVYIFHLKIEPMRHDFYFENVFSYGDGEQCLWKLRKLWHRDAKQNADLDHYDLLIAWLPEHILDDVIHLVRRNRWFFQK